MVSKALPRYRVVPFSFEGRRLSAYALFNLVDQILPHFLRAWAAHTDQCPRKEVENKKGEASNTLTFGRVTMRAARLFVGLDAHINKPGGGNLIRLGFFPFTAMP